MSRSDPLIPLEATIEAKFMKLVKRFPVKVRKMNGTGFRSWPDRLLLGPKKFVMLVEFKRPKVGKLSEGQKALFEELEEMRHPVLVTTSAEYAIAELERRLIEHGVEL